MLVINQNIAIIGLIWRRSNMPKLSGYNQFQGLHWETGSLRNSLDFQGVTAPHTGQPYSEAMLLGISGGIVMGYFTFAYQGYDPMVQILTRNTFDPSQKIYERLEIKTNVRQTTSPDKGVNNLLEVLEAGLPAIVYADMFSLPYNAVPYDQGTWGMFPILVYGFDEDSVNISDRARVPLTITGNELAAARGRTKKNKYRLLTLEPPNPNKLRSAVEAGLRNCIELFTQAPPKGSKNNFGFLAYKKWAELLIKNKGRGSWQQEYPPGRKMYAALISAFQDVSVFGKDGGGEREVYAQFLDEAGDILGNPALTEIAQQFRTSAHAWDELAAALLPGEVPLFKETRELMLDKHHSFLNRGNAALDDIHKNNDRLDEIMNQVSQEFPLTNVEATELNASVSEKVLEIHDIEYEAIDGLQKSLV
jgi:hypothetical protein